MRYFYADAQGQVVGPVDLDALRALRRAGTLTDGSSVIEEGGAAWQTLAAYVAPAPAPAPASTPAPAPVPRAASPAPAAATVSVDERIRGAREVAHATARVVGRTATATAQGLARAVEEAATPREPTVSLDHALAGAAAAGPDAETPTAAALRRVTHVEQVIGRTPIPGESLNTLRRSGVLLGAFVVAAIAGVYTTAALDKWSVHRAEARAERQMAEAQEQQVDARYEMLAEQVPGPQLEQLLEQAGSREALVRRITQTYDGRWTLRPE